MDSFNLELIGTILIGVLGIVLICQGHYIFHGKHGYKHSEREKKKSQDTRKQIEDLLKDK
jgi:hypothetical protein